MNSCRVAFVQIIAKKSNSFMGGEYVKVCVVKAVGIFFFLSLMGSFVKLHSF